MTNVIAARIVTKLNPCSVADPPDCPNCSRKLTMAGKISIRDCTKTNASNGSKSSVAIAMFVSFAARRCASTTAVMVSIVALMQEWISKGVFLSTIVLNVAYNAMASSTLATRQHVSTTSECRRGIGHLKNGRSTTPVLGKRHARGLGGRGGEGRGGGGRGSTHHCHILLASKLFPRTHILWRHRPCTPCHDFAPFSHVRRALIFDGRPLDTRGESPSSTH